MCLVISKQQTYLRGRKISKSTKTNRGSRSEETFLNEQRKHNIIYMHGVTLYSLTTVLLKITKFFNGMTISSSKLS